MAFPSQPFKMWSNRRGKHIVGNSITALLKELPNRKRLPITLVLVNHTSDTRTVRNNRENIILHAVRMFLMRSYAQYLVRGKHSKLSLLNLVFDRRNNIQ